MRLYEWLILAAWVPLCWFGCMWLYRILAAVTIAKLGGQALKQLKGVDNQDG